MHVERIVFTVTSIYLYACIVLLPDSLKKLCKSYDNKNLLNAISMVQFPVLRVSDSISQAFDLISISDSFSVYMKKNLSLQPL